MDYFGHSVSLSSDGSIVAIGAYEYNGTGYDGKGYVKVYKYNDTSWTKLGQDIDGEATGDRNGWSVSLSSDGSIVAIETIQNNGNGGNSGQVRVYQYSDASDNWTKLGQY